MSKTLQADFVGNLEERIEKSYEVVERRHRNELAARTLTPVPGMDDFMHGVLREARRFEYRRTAFAATEACHPHSMRGSDALRSADAMIEREGKDA